MRDATVASIELRETADGPYLAVDFSLDGETTASREMRLAGASLEHAGGVAQLVEATAPQWPSEPAARYEGTLLTPHSLAEALNECAVGCSVKASVVIEAGTDRVVEIAEA